MSQFINSPVSGQGGDLISQLQGIVADERRHKEMLGQQALQKRGLDLELQKAKMQAEQQKAALQHNAQQQDLNRQNEMALKLETNKQWDKRNALDEKMQKSAHAFTATQNYLDRQQQTKLTTEQAARDQERWAQNRKDQFEILAREGANAAQIRAHERKMSAIYGAEMARMQDAFEALQTDGAEIQRQRVKALETAGQNLKEHNLVVGYNPEASTIYEETALTRMDDVLSDIFLDRPEDTQMMQESKGNAPFTQGAVGVTGDARDLFSNYRRASGGNFDPDAWEKAKQDFRDPAARADNQRSGMFVETESVQANESDGVEGILLEAYNSLQRGFEEDGNPEAMAGVVPVVDALLKLDRAKREGGDTKAAEAALNQAAQKVAAPLVDLLLTRAEGLGRSLRAQGENLDPDEKDKNKQNLRAAHEKAGAAVLKLRSLGRTANEDLFMTHDDRVEMLEGYVKELAGRRGHDAITQSIAEIPDPENRKIIEEAYANVLPALKEFEEEKASLKESQRDLFERMSTEDMEFAQKELQGMVNFAKSRGIDISDQIFDDAGMGPVGEDGIPELLRRRRESDE